MWTFRSEAEIVSQNRIRELELNSENLHGQNIFIEKNNSKDEAIIFFEITETDTCLDDYSVPQELLSFLKNLKYQQVNLESLSQIFDIEVDLPFQIQALWFRIVGGKLHTKKFQLGSFETFVKKEGSTVVTERLKGVHTYIKPAQYGENEDNILGIFNELHQNDFLKIIHILSERELNSKNNFYYGSTETGKQCCSLKEAISNFYTEEYFDLSDLKSITLTTINHSGRMNMSYPELIATKGGITKISSAVMLNSSLPKNDDRQKIFDLYSSLISNNWYTTNIKHILYKLLGIIDERPNIQHSSLSLSSAEFYKDILAELILRLDKTVTLEDFTKLEDFLSYFIFKSEEDFGISQINFRLKN